VSIAFLPVKYANLPRFSFGDSPALADELLALVLSGRKTATCTTPDDPNLSRPGDQWVVLDGRGRPACVIETIEIAMRRYDEVDAPFAFDEGEDDRSLDAWRRAHRNYFTRLGKFGETMMLVCERFRLVEVLDRREAPP
jgi:uncharacterized protein YhfF